jgi:hypothetical protein
MKEAHTSKLYWKIWTHKVTINLGDTVYKNSELSNEERALNLQENTNRKEVLAFVKSMENLDFKSLESSETLYRIYPDNIGLNAYNGYGVRSNCRLNLYFKDAKMLDALLESRFSDLIIYVEKPFNDAHLIALEKEKSIVRTSLWHQKYRYRMRSKHRQYSHYGAKINAINKEIDDWLHENLVKSRKRVVGQDFKILESNYLPPCYYFAHADDAMFFRLTWGAEMKSVERIKLISELDNSTDA